MKKLRIYDLKGPRSGHILAGHVSGKDVRVGGFHRFKPGEVAHGTERHTHPVEEVFIVLQGKATLPVDGKTYELQAGDIAIVDPGEDHHMTGDEADPAVVVWFHVH